MKRTVYLDYAAATPVDKRVLAAIQPYQTERFYNPSALYLASQSVAKDIGLARSVVAQSLGAKPDEIIFTAGGSEANNLAIVGILAKYPTANIVTSGIEHDSVLEQARQFKHEEVKTQPNGLIDLVDLEKSIDDNTVLVSVMYANNEVGSIQPIRQIAKIIEKIRVARRDNNQDLPLYFHTDACQAANYLDLHVHRLGVDLMTLNGGKIYGPKQSGILFKGSKLQLEPIIRGGGQEWGLRSGTENVANIVGFSTALELVQEKREVEAKRLMELRDYFIAELKHRTDVIINGSQKSRLPNNVHITIPGQDNERLLMALDEHGIMCATGSACSASKEEVSHVLHSMGISDADARSSLRFTLGQQTTKTDIDYIVETLQKITL
jgi:cysteine desulfurase